MTVIKVTREQVLAARIEVRAFHTAGIENQLDPLVVKLANVRLDDDPPAGPGGDEDGEDPTTKFP
jgi:hypothetical protein